MSVELRIFLGVVLILVLYLASPKRRAQIKDLFNPSPYAPPPPTKSASLAGDGVVVGDAPAVKRKAPPPKQIGGGIEERRAQLGDFDLGYLTGGKGEGRSSVLLLHGLTGDKEQWIPLIGQLMAAGYHAVAPDLPGCGGNEKDAEESYDVTSQIKRLRLFVARLALAPVHLVGSSIGGTLAAALAYSLKDDAASLTLIEPFGLRVPYETELAKLLTKNRNPFLISTPAAYDNLLAFLCAAPPAADAHAAVRARRAAEDRAINQKIWQDLCEGERANLLDVLLPELKVKTLYLQGAESKVVHPKTADLVPTIMPHARSVTIADSGHLPMLEKPAETAEQLIEFLESA